MHTHTHTHAHAHAHAHTHTRARTHAHAHTHTHTHAHTRTHARTHARTRTHTHTRTRKAWTVLYSVSTDTRESHKLAASHLGYQALRGAVVCSFRIFIPAVTTESPTSFLLVLVPQSCPAL